MSFTRVLQCFGNENHICATVPPVQPISEMLNHSQEMKENSSSWPSLTECLAEVKKVMSSSLMPLPDHHSGSSGGNDVVTTFPMPGESSHYFFNLLLEKVLVWLVKGDGSKLLSGLINPSLKPATSETTTPGYIPSQTEEKRIQSPEFQKEMISLLELLIILLTDTEGLLNSPLSKTTLITLIKDLGSASFFSLILEIKHEMLKLLQIHDESEIPVTVVDEFIFECSVLMGIWNPEDDSISNTGSELWDLEDLISCLHYHRSSSESPLAGMFKKIAALGPLKSKESFCSILDLLIQVNAPAFREFLSHLSKKDLKIWQLFCWNQLVNGPIPPPAQLRVVRLLSWVELYGGVSANDENTPMIVVSSIIQGFQANQLCLARLLESPRMMEWLWTIARREHVWRPFATQVTKHWGHDILPAIMTSHNETWMESLRSASCISALSLVLQSKDLPGDQSHLAFLDWVILLLEYRTSQFGFQEDDDATAEQIVAILLSLLERAKIDSPFLAQVLVLLLQYVQIDCHKSRVKLQIQQPLIVQHICRFAIKYLSDYMSLRSGNERPEHGLLNPKVASQTCVNLLIQILHDFDPKVDCSEVVEQSETQNVAPQTAALVREIIASFPMLWNVIDSFFPDTDFFKDPEEDHISLVQALCILNLAIGRKIQEMPRGLLFTCGQNLGFDELRMIEFHFALLSPYIQGGNASLIETKQSVHMSSAKFKEFRAATFIRCRGMILSGNHVYEALTLMESLLNINEAEHGHPDHLNVLASNWTGALFDVALDAFFDNTQNQRRLDHTFGFVRKLEASSTEDNAYDHLIMVAIWFHRILLQSRSSNANGAPSKRFTASLLRLVRFLHSKFGEKDIIATNRMRHQASEDLDGAEETQSEPDSGAISNESGTNQIMDPRIKHLIFAICHETHALQHALKDLVLIPEKLRSKWVEIHDISWWFMRSASPIDECGSLSDLARAFLSRPVDCDSILADKDNSDEKTSEVQPYEVEFILDSRKHKGSLQYLIQWKGWSEPTWESPADDQNLTEKERERVFHLLHSEKPK